MTEPIPTILALDDFRSAITGSYEEVRKEFGGEDPCVPLIRSALDEARTQLEETYEHLRWLDPAVQLPEISDEDLEVPRKIMERAERLYE